MSSRAQLYSGGGSSLVTHLYKTSKVRGGRATANLGHIELGRQLNKWPSVADGGAKPHRRRVGPDHGGGRDGKTRERRVI